MVGANHLLHMQWQQPNRPYNKKLAIVPKLGRVGWFYFKLNVMESWSRSLFSVETVIESDELRIVGGRNPLIKPIGAMINLQT